jgi:hypothetical protein
VVVRSRVTVSRDDATMIDLGAPGSGIWSTVSTQVRRKAPSPWATPATTASCSATPTTSLNDRVVSDGRLNVSGF